MMNFGLVVILGCVTSICALSSNQHISATGEPNIELDDEENTDVTSTNYEKKIIFALMENGTTDYTRLYLDNDTALENSSWNSSKKTVFVIHGWMNTISSPVITETAAALLQYYDFNVIGVGWGSIADDIIYSLAVGAVNKVGKYVGEFVSYLVDQGAVADEIHLIGHSLGAHVAGYAGKYLNSVNRTIGRITGLDAARPFFSSSDASKRLNATDASFVDCIHTDGGWLGFDRPICQADFYPDGGDGDQPGCTFLEDFDGACSHSRSYEYYIESINKTHMFLGDYCTTMGKKIPTNCSWSEALMGDPASPEYTGLYIVQTNAEYPYAKLILSE